jgi:hypothetical protein
MFRRGGLATQADYPYEGINNFCRKDAGDQGFKGGCCWFAGLFIGSLEAKGRRCRRGRQTRHHFLHIFAPLSPAPLLSIIACHSLLTCFNCPPAAGHWVLVEGGEEALKEALLLKGPMVVSSEQARGEGAVCCCL